MKTKEVQISQKRKQYHKEASPFPASLFTPEQLTYILKYVQGERDKLNDHYSGRREILKQSGFVFLFWERLLYNEVLKPRGIPRPVFRCLVFLWCLQTSPRHNKELFTRKYLEAVYRDADTGESLDLLKCLRSLRKYDYVTTYRHYNRTLYYVVSGKGMTLIRTYSRRYSQLFNDFFQPA